MHRAVPKTCDNPVFVIGSPRSGTSIIPWSLAQHSQFWTSRESDLLYNLFGGGRVEKAFTLAEGRPEGTWLQEQKVDLKEFLAALGLGLNLLFTSRSGDRRWVDQTPLNTLMVQTLADMFPGARFLHTLRDGRRVVHSMLHFNDMLPEEMRAKMQAAGVLAKWTVDFTEACRTWRHFVQIAIDFGQKVPHRYLTVRLDHLTAEPERGFRSILEFLDAPYEAASAHYFQNYRINSSFQTGSTQNRTEISVAEIWNGWSEADRDIFRREVGQTMIECGFEFDPTN